MQLTKQKTHSVFVNKALAKSTEFNVLGKNIIVDNDWQNVIEQSEPQVWKLLTN